MRKILGILAAGLLTTVALTGCVGANARDLEGIPPMNPQKIEVYMNVDGFPNVTRLCIAGLAFVTTSRDMDALSRVPQWDSWCAA